MPPFPGLAMTNLSQNNSSCIGSGIFYGQHYIKLLIFQLIDHIAIRIQNQMVNLLLGCYPKLYSGFTEALNQVQDDFERETFFFPTRKLASKIKELCR
jgi:hypothetical protein